MSVLLLLCLMLAPTTGFCKVKPVKVAPDTRRQIMRLIRMNDPLNMAEEDAVWLKEQLETYTPSLAAHWQALLDFFRYANTDMPVHIGEIPDDLPQGNNLCFIVLGYQLYPNGKMRDELIGRLEVALQCAEKYPEAVILCTGGPTATGDSSKAEAKEMTKWLKQHGVNAKRILTEGQSMTTAKNASYSYRLLRSRTPQVDSAVIVSSEYHIAWASVLFEAQFLLAADAEDGQKIHVISNTAFDTEEYEGDYFPYYGGISEVVQLNNIETRYFK